MSFKSFIISLLLCITFSLSTEAKLIILELPEKKTSQFNTNIDLDISSEQLEAAEQLFLHRKPSELPLACLLYQYIKIVLDPYRQHHIFHVFHKNVLISSHYIANDQPYLLEVLYEGIVNNIFEIMNAPATFFDSEDPEPEKIHIRIDIPE